MKSSILIDITGLLNTAKKHGEKHIPTGIERVVFAYLQHYQENAQAALWQNRRLWVFSRKISRQLFQLFLSSREKKVSKIKSLIRKGKILGWRKHNFSNSFLLKIDYGKLENNYFHYLKQRNIKPIFVLHDLIPITYPEYFVLDRKNKHIALVNNILSSAQGIITVSKTVQAALVAYATQHNQCLPPLIHASLASSKITGVLPGVRPIVKPYFVIIGTIEPRKNHLLLLQLWRRLIEILGDQAPHLVVIGQRGWECEQVVDLLERSDQLKGFVIEHAATDAEVVTYLHHAQALLFPTFAEGYGIPLVEALVEGTPVIASDLTVFKEIAGNVPEYLDPLDGKAWLEMIMDYMHSNSEHRINQLQRIAAFTPPTWSQHFQKIDAFLEHLSTV